MGPDVRRSDGAVPLNGDGVEAHQPLPHPAQLLVDGPDRTTTHRRAGGGGWFSTLLQLGLSHRKTRQRREPWMPMRDCPVPTRRRAALSASHMFLGTNNTQSPAQENMKMRMAPRLSDVTNAIVFVRHYKFSYRSDLEGSLDGDLCVRGARRMAL